MKKMGVLRGIWFSFIAASLAALCLAGVSCDLLSNLGFFARQSMKYEYLDIFY